MYRVMQTKHLNFNLIGAFKNVIRCHNALLRVFDLLFHKKVVNLLLTCKCDS